MRRVLRLSALLVAVALVSAGSCLLTGHWISPHQAPGSESRADAEHQWIHRELNLTREQDEALHAVEQRYADQRNSLEIAIRQANTELARAIREDRTDSPRVAAAVDKIHHAQGELQKLTLEHVFEMRQALTSVQYDKLLNLMAAALEADGK